MIKTVYKGGIGEIVEKKSRFICTVIPVESEEEAVKHIAALKKQYWDARHNCHAFVIGPNHELSRCSDDGEPSGTAGRPMLDVLLREDVHNVLVVVTRYFGGTLLGTGGLVRAYQGAVQEGLKASQIIEKQYGIPLTIYTDYNGIGKIQYILAQDKIAAVDTTYADKVTITVMVPTEACPGLIKKITEATSGQAQFEEDDPMLFAILDGQVELFDA